MSDLRQLQGFAAQAEQHSGKVRSGGRREWAAASSALVNSVAEDESVDVITNEIARHALVLLGLDMCAVMRPTPARDQLTVTGSAGLSPNYIERLHSEHPLRVDRSGATQPSPSVESFIKGTTVAVPDIQQSNGMTDWRELALAEGYAALIATPLVEGDEITGVIVGYSRMVRNFSTVQVELLEMFAVHAGATIQAARRRDALQLANRELNAANQTLRGQRHSLEKQDRQHRRLMQVMANDVGLSGVVTMLAELLNSSVTVEDSQGRVMASATRGTYIAPPLIDEREKNGVGQMIAHVTAARVGAVLIDVSDGVAVPFWLSPVTLHNEVIAYLWVGRHGLVLDDVGRVGVERFALAVALEISKQRSTAQVRLQMSRDLVSDLLSEINARDSSSLIERGTALGHDLLRPHVVIIARADEIQAANARAMPQAAEFVVRSRFPDVLIGSAGGDAVLLVPASARLYSQIAEAVVEEFERRSPGHTAFAVISSASVDLAAVAGHYRIARGAIELLVTREHRKVVDLAELGVGALLLSHGDWSALSAFADRLLLPLDRMEKPRADELIRTIELWLDSDRSIARVAATLMVHPNTVTYRINALEDQFQRSLRDPSFLVDFKMALMIRETGALME